MLGIALIRKCIEEDCEVTAIVRNNSGNLHRLEAFPGINIICCDITEYSNLEIQGNHQYDVFYHLAWCGTNNKYHEDADLQSSNIRYTLDAIALAKRLGCNKFIGAGSQTEYGPFNAPMKEDGPANPKSAYGKAKYMAGINGAQKARELNIEFVWTRIFSVYGIFDRENTLTMHCLSSFIRGNKLELTKCEQIWEFLNSRDAAQAFYLIGMKGISQSVYNIGSGEGRLLKEFVTLIRDIVAPGEQISFGAKDYNPNQTMFLVADISNLRKDTGFEPTIKFEDGIKELSKWYKEEYFEED